MCLSQSPGTFLGLPVLAPTCCLTQAIASFPTRLRYGALHCFSDLAPSPCGPGPGCCFSHFCSVGFLALSTFSVTGQCLELANTTLPLCQVPRTCILLSPLRRLWCLQLVEVAVAVDPEPCSCPLLSCSGIQECFCSGRLFKMLPSISHGEADSFLK